MIQSFKHKGLKRLYEKDDASLIRPDLLKTVREILTLLDVAGSPHALNLPGFRLHPLKGDRKGFWAMTVRANWRIIFRTWLQMQLAYDLAQARKHEGKIRVDRYESVSA